MYNKVQKILKYFVTIQVPLLIFGSTTFCVEATIGKAESLIIISVGRRPANRIRPIT